MKKLVGKITSDQRYRIVASVLSIISLLGLYSLQGSLLNKAIAIKIQEGETFFSQQIMLEVLYVFAFLIIIVLGMVLYSTITQKKPFERFSQKNIKITILLFVTSLVVQWVINLIEYLINGQNQSANNRQIEEIANLGPDFAIVILSTAILMSPMFEELIYRGLIIDGIFKNQRFLGVVVQALLFAAGHMTDDVIQFLSFCVTGLFLGLIYLKTDKIEYSMLGHFFQNLIAGILMIIDITSQ